MLSEYDIPETKIGVAENYNLKNYVPLETDDNILTFRVVVEYTNDNAGSVQYKLPTGCDDAYPVVVTSLKSGKAYDLEYTVEGDTLTFNKVIYGDIIISYVPSKGSECRNFDKIFGCRVTNTYGGTTSAGTRVFFSGNKEYPGYYFYSEMLSPLTVRSLSAS